MTPEQQITLDQLDELLYLVQSESPEDYKELMKNRDDELAIIRVIRLIKEQL